MNSNQKYKQLKRFFSAYTYISLAAMAVIIIVSLALKEYVSAIAVSAVFVALFAYSVIVALKRENNVNNYLKLLPDVIDTVSADALLNLPLPMAVLELDGMVTRYNASFGEVFNREDFLNTPLQNIIPDLRWSEILKSGSGIDMNVNYNDHNYTVRGNIVKHEDNGSDKFVVIMYWIDHTDTVRLQKMYDDQKTDIALISIDNYDEFVQSIGDAERTQLLAQIDRHINEWAEQADAVLKKTERDRYICIFEHQYLEEYIKNKFDVIEKIRELGDSYKVPVTMSIGIGTGSTLQANESLSRNAIDIALGRGGDQAVVKNESQTMFYGGKTKEYEKSTRVRTRAVAHALKQFILESDKVIIMGHSGLDFDSFGSAMGLQRAVRTLGKTPYIVFEQNSTIKQILPRIEGNSEYEGMFVNAETAAAMTDSSTLVIVVDTHKESRVSCKEALTRTKKIVVIDHHRRGSEFIQNTCLVYHEPYASSACEMVAELLQYIDSRVKINTGEAECMYAGIVLDTKKFVLKTGARTFEAAAYLRKHGVDTVAIKNLFKLNISDYTRKADIIKTAEIIDDNIAIAMCRETGKDVNIIIAQAADELLNINGVSASFVLCDTDGEIIISARSLGDINVQRIMEMMGGGGHMTIAGVQIKESTLEQAKEMVLEAIDAYMAENGE